MYFDQSIAAAANGDKAVADVVNSITKRHISANPPADYLMTAQLENNFAVEKSARTVIDFNKIYPHAENGNVAYAKCYVESENDCSVIFFCDFSADTVFYLNDEMIGKTIDCDEALGDVRKIYGELKKGKNTLLLRCRKNELGFGAKIGRVSHRAEPFWFKSDTDKIKGVLGWTYSRLYESETEDVQWCEFTDLEDDFKSVFAEKHGFAYTAMFLECENDGEVRFSLKTNSEFRIYINGKNVAAGDSDKDFTAFCRKGCNFIAAEVLCGGESEFAVTLQGGLHFSCFKPECDYKFLYTGPFEKRDDNLLKEFKPEYLPAGLDYWRLCRGITLRLTDGESLFGKWSYPLGVSIRGMLAWAKKTNDAEVKNYIDSYIQKLCDVYEYARWDAEKYTVSFVIRQQSIIELPDDFGSFVSALIDYSIDNPNETTDKIIRRGADYVKNTLPRLKDGTMHRRALLPLHHNINHNHLTMWADDLYMGGCFMCRYYAYSGDVSFIDDAALQFKKYFEYLYIEEKGLMSHVYSLRRGSKTNVPWGRGNGWVLFSLTELLGVMPKEHKDYDEIVKIFRVLCESLCSYQDEEGMWHQVISDGDSFAEASCTAMFGCAFLRGVKNGWIKGDKFVSAALKAWRALTRYCIDSDGNIYGICKGSGFSFRENYYKNELPWVFNDTHGMGIILLFGTEVYDYADLKR